MSAVAIAGVLSQHFRSKLVPITLSAVGAGAVNQSVKGIAIATSRLLDEDGRVLLCSAKMEDGIERGSGRPELSRVSITVKMEAPA